MNWRVLFNRIFRRKEVELRIKSMGVDTKKKTTYLHMYHPVFVRFISSCIDLFDGSGAVNHLEMRFFNVADMKFYEVTIKPENGLPCGAINSRLRKALEEIADGEGDQAIVSAQALIDCGYDRPMTPEAVAYLRRYFPFVEYGETDSE